MNKDKILKILNNLLFVFENGTYGEPDEIGICRALYGLYEAGEITSYEHSFFLDYFHNRNRDRKRFYKKGQTTPIKVGDIITCINDVKIPLEQTVGLVAYCYWPMGISGSAKHRIKWIKKEIKLLSQ